MKFVEHAIDQYIESVTEEREPDGMYHPSSMFLCDRQVIYGVRGVPVTNPVDKQSKRNFYLGHRIHEIVQRALESYDGVKAVYPEFEVHLPDFNIKGHGDVLVQLNDERWIVVEVKSTKRFSIKFGLPKEEHKQQVRMYAWAAKNHTVTAVDEMGVDHILGPLDIVGVQIVYVVKDDLGILEYFIPYDEDWDVEVADKLWDLEIYREDPKSLPPRLPLKADGKKQWPCNYCPWKDRCWKVDPREIEPADEEA